MAVYLLIREYRGVSGGSVWVGGSPYLETEIFGAITAETIEEAAKKLDAELTQKNGTSNELVRPTYKDEKYYTDKNPRLYLVKMPLLEGMTIKQIFDKYKLEELKPQYTFSR